MADHGRTVVQDRGAATDPAGGQRHIGTALDIMTTSPCWPFLKHILRLQLVINMHFGVYYFLFNQYDLPLLD